jgi:hypothetical protein
MRGETVRRCPMRGGGVCDRGCGRACAILPRRRFELGVHLLGTRVDINGARFMYLRDGSFIGAHIRGKNWTCLSGSRP